MHNSINETKMVATVLLVSELEAHYHCSAVHTLTTIFPDNLYLVSQQPAIPPVYYAIPSVASQCEQALATARKELYFWGNKLEIPPQRCLLLLSSYFCFTKNKLQQQLTRQLSCPVQILTITADEP